jgi:hypothetical protein
VKAVPNRITATSAISQVSDQSLRLQGDACV